MLENIEFLFKNRGEISIGSSMSRDFTATASDLDQCLAILVRRPGETLLELLQRLDAAIEDAYENETFVDEVNG